MKKRNCWEAKACGREPGGRNAERLGVCPAALPGSYDGVNRGEKGGRFCWAISGTYCGNRVQGTFAAKLMSCINCEFFKEVQDEESQDFKLDPRSLENKSGNK
ncbi:MAG: two-CW domain-containing protein [Thermodesulfobacteriota bacterium]